MVKTRVAFSKSSASTRERTLADPVLTRKQGALVDHTGCLVRCAEAMVRLRRRASS